jgi:sirohydrochlorin cobaltochelatase
MLRLVRTRTAALRKEARVVRAGPCDLRAPRLSMESMSPEDFSDAVVVLLGHGASENADASAPVFQHAAVLRERKLFAEVREAFWKQDPGIQDVLASLQRRRIFIVPLFMSEGHFSGQVIPDALGFPAGNSEIRNPKSEIHYCLPVGTHPRFAEVVVSRAAEVVRQFPFPREPQPRETTLFIAGHGTLQNENSRKSVEDQAARVRATDIYAAVHSIFLEETPKINECYALASTRHMIVVPFFLGEGLHTRQDIPVQLGESGQAVRQRLAAGKPAWRNPTEKQGKLVWLAAPAGTSPAMVDVVLDRVRDAAEQS